MAGGPKALLPAENMALTVAKAQLARGENPPINTTAALVLTIERLTGQGDGLINLGASDTGTSQAGANDRA